MFRSNYRLNMTQENRYNFLHDAYTEIREVMPFFKG